jgi:lipopolysaccharide/colanic/teichoic acid biosynthesis glycosyltransferase
MSTTGPRRWYRDAVKRALDVVVAGAVLLITWPLLVLVAALVRVCLGAPVLFRQTRPGRHGRPFVLYKFRTMKSAGLAPVPSDAERLTRFGRWLRASSLDELPQLINVVRGDMSLVGPRPLLVEYLSRYTPVQRRRHEVRPGITGLAQVSGRNGLDWATRLALDVEYVDRVSLGLDARIFARTLWKLVTRQGVTQPGQATVEEFRGGVSRGVSQ